MTLTEAYKIAESKVGALYQTSPGQRAYNVWSESYDAWMQGISQPTAVARENRCRTMVLATLIALGWDEYDADVASEDDRFASGDYRTRVRSIIAGSRKN